MAEDLRIDEVLSSWFGRIPTRHFGFRELAATVSRFPFWYGKLFSFLNVDKALSSRYATLVQSAREGELSEWEESRAGRLALIILLDQIPRNIYRHQSQAFESDAAALRIAERAIELGDDKLVHSLARTFYYFPFMHQESACRQDRSVELNKSALFEANCLNLCNVIGVYVSSLRHQSIIRKFARYPHRNHALGRVNTPEEERFLKMPFSSF